MHKYQTEIGESGKPYLTYLIQPFSMTLNESHFRRMKLFQMTTQYGRGTPSNSASTYRLCCWQHFMPIRHGNWQLKSAIPWVCFTSSMSGKY